MDRYGTVSLAKGTYRLTRPLVLNRAGDVDVRRGRDASVRSAVDRVELDDGDQGSLR